MVCMNKERYLKLKKDFIVLYLARNGIMTFLITLFTFSLDLSNYYQISFPATIPYIFFNNIFTLMYFCLLWIFKWISSSSGWSGSGKPGKRTGYEPYGLLYF